MRSMQKELQQYHYPGKNWRSAAKVCSAVAIAMIAILVTGVVIRIVFDSTIGRSEDIYEVFRINNEFNNENVSTDDIRQVIYGKDTAVIIYEDGALLKRFAVAKDADSMWRYSGLFSKSTVYEGDAAVSVFSTLRNGEVYALVRFPLRSELQWRDVEITDIYGSVFYDIRKNPGDTPEYFAYIPATQNQYTIWVDGEEISFELE